MLRVTTAVWVTITVVRFRTTAVRVITNINKCAPHTSINNMPALNSLSGYSVALLLYAYITTRYATCLCTFDEALECHIRRIKGLQAHIYGFCLDSRTQRLSMKICSPLPKTIWNKLSLFLKQTSLDNAQYECLFNSCECLSLYYLHLLLGNPVIAAGLWVILTELRLLIKRWAVSLIGDWGRVL